MRKLKPGRVVFTFWPLTENGWPFGEAVQRSAYVDSDILFDRMGRRPSIQHRTETFVCRVDRRRWSYITDESGELTREMQDYIDHFIWSE